MKPINHIRLILKLVFKQEYPIIAALEDINEILQVLKFTYFMRGFAIGGVIAIFIMSYLKK